MRGQAKEIQCAKKFDSVSLFNGTLHTMHTHTGRETMQAFRWRYITNNFEFENFRCEGRPKMSDGKCSATVAVEFSPHTFRTFEIDAQSECGIRV